MEKARDVPTRHGGVHDVFVSYSRSDIETVRRLEAHLEEMDLQPWIDYREIPPSFDWMQEVRDGIVRAQAFVSVISERYMTSEICQIELSHAIDSGKRIIVVEEPQDVLPDDLRRTNWIFCRTQADVPDAASALVQAVTSDPEWTSLHTALLIRAAEWDEGGRSRSSLIRGSELRLARAELREPRMDSQPQTNALQIEYLEASESAATRRHRAFSVAGIALATAAVIGTVVVSSSLRRAMESEQEASLQEQTSQSRSLAAQAMETLERDVRVGSLLAIEAYLEQPTPDAFGALLQAAEASEDVERRLGDVGGIATSLAATQGGDLIVAAGAGGTMRAWDQNGSGIEISDAPNTVFDLALQADGSRLAGALSNGDIAIWEIRADRILGPQIHDAHQFEASAVDYSVSGLLASAGNDGRVLIWDADMDPSELYVTEGLALTSVRWATDGTRLAVVHKDGIEVIPANDPSSITSIDIEASDAARSLVWIDTNSLVVAVDDHIVRMSEAESGYVLEWTSEPLHEQVITALDLTRDSTLAVTVARDATATVVDLETGEIVEPRRRVHPTRVLTVATLEEGFVSADGDGSVIQWASGASRRLERAQPGLTGNPLDVTSSERAAVMVIEDELLVRREGTGAMSLGNPLDTISAVALDSDATVVAAASPTGELIVLSIEAIGSNPLRFDMGVEVTEMHFVGSDYLAWGGPGGEFGVISLLEGGSSVDAQSLSGSVTAISSDPRSSTVFVAGDSSSLAVVDISSAEIVGEESLHTDWINTVSVNQSTGLLATAAAEPDGVVIRRLDGSDPVYLREAHDARILALDFNSEGTRLASGDRVGQVALWAQHDSDWRLVHVFTVQGMKSGVRSVGFQTDGSLLVAGYGTDTVKLIIEPTAVIQSLCSIVRSDLTDDERSRFALQPGQSTCSDSHE